MKPDRRLLKLLSAVFLISALQGCSILRKDPNALQKSADDALAQGDTTRATKLLDRAVRSNDTPPERHAQLGALYRSQGTINARLRSQQTLERSLQRYPNEANLWLELGKTQYAQTFYGDAKQCFEEVLRLDPANCEAQFYLGINWVRKWKWIQAYKEYLAQAIPHLRTVVDCDPENTEAHYKLAFSTFARGDTIGALALSEQLIAAHEDVAQGYFLRGTIAYRRGDFELTDSLFAQALSVITDDELNGYLGIGHLLTDEQVLEYEFASDAKRRDMERAYWAERDPDLTTPLNELYLEHIHRMYLADAFYDNRTPRLRGWETERGKALIKFGWPDGFGSTLAGGSLTGPTEVWIYQNQFLGLTLVFRDKFLNGNYMIPNHNYYAAQALYLDPPITHYLSPYWKIPGVMDVLAFRGDGSTADVYLAMKVDLETLGDFVDFQVADRFIARTAFFDEGWQPETFDVDTLQGRIFVEHRRRDDHWFYMVQKYDVAFDSLQVAFCLEDDRARTQTVMGGETSTERYLSESLVLSDILLYQPTPKDKVIPLIQRGNEVFAPNPGGIYQHPEKLRLYIEVYNLDVKESQSDYDITYSIYEADDAPKGWVRRVARGLKHMMGFRKPPEPVISQTLQRRGPRHRAEEKIAVDIDALKPGDYVLRVSARDHKSGDGAERIRGFTKSPQRAGGLAGEQ